MEKLFCPHCKKEITDAFKDHIDKMGISKGLEIAKKKENELKATFDEETKKVKKEADKKNELKDIEHNKERVRWKKTTEKMKQEMEQKITVDQGSGQEIILGNHLKEIFKDEDDEIIPYEKGEPGADWLQEIKVRGEKVGRILYESKRTKSFSGDWLQKLQTDMDDVKASYGILFTLALPSEFKKNQFHKQKGNIIICKYDFTLLGYIAYGVRNLISESNIKNKGKGNIMSGPEIFENADIKNAIYADYQNLYKQEEHSSKLKKLASSFDETVINRRKNLEKFKIRIKELINVVLNLESKKNPKK